MTETDSIFGKVSDDIVLKILFQLEDDPRNWSRMACVDKRFCSLIRTVCWKSKCLSTIPAVAADLVSSDAAPSGDWADLHKVSVCCPGLLYAGVLLESSDFGLERELGPHEDYQKREESGGCGSSDANKASSSNGSNRCSPLEIIKNSGNSESDDCCWSLYDDLYFDTLYNNSEIEDYEFHPLEAPSGSTEDEAGKIHTSGGIDQVLATGTKRKLNGGDGGFLVNKKRKMTRPLRSHLAAGMWNLSREQGNKLLASRFRGDSLYICDWPGCVHIEEKRNYMLFRGLFKNFKRSLVWRTINDGSRSKVNLNCAFCASNQSWDLQSAFCLKRGFGYHDDGEPVVRAYVCENGHVSGAWTEWPLYT